MSSDLRIENVLIQIRSKLQNDEIKLWLPPYYENDFSNEAELENLAKNYSASLNINIDYCLAAISELQNNAIDKLNSRKEFLLTGVATLKIRIPNQPGGTKLLTIQQNLTEMGYQLQTEIAKELNSTPSKIKLICSGKVLNGDECLKDQGVVNNQQILALILQATPEENVVDNELYDRVKNVKADAEILMNKSDSLMHMEDQAGNAIHMPTLEKKQLMMALALHEKGRSALRKNDFSGALVMFLESDNEFNKCNPKWLDAVDNYALLNLDIVWCYLCLKSVMQLPDSERRLFICEQNLRKSYGADMDRVVALKGTAANEKALLMRLHLLQAVVYFHQNRRNEAQGMLSLAESELRNLKINDHSLQILMEMGYTSREARLGLRSCNGDVELAAHHIMEQNEKRSIARKKAKEERDLENVLQLKSDDDAESWVNPRNLHVLVEMGWPKKLCALALKKCNNDMSLAINMIQEKREELDADLKVSEKNINEMEKIGFDKEMIKMALQMSSDDMNSAIDFLLKLQNNGNYNTMLENIQSTFAINNENQAAGPSTSTSSSNDNNKKSQDLFKKMKREFEEISAYKRFAEDFEGEDGEDHLDLPLDLEENVLIEYKKYLNME